jgi:hypothetical protein
MSTLRVGLIEADPLSSCRALYVGNFASVREPVETPQLSQHLCL